MKICLSVRHGPYSSFSSSSSYIPRYFRYLEKDPAEHVKVPFFSSADFRYCARNKFLTIFINTFEEDNIASGSKLVVSSLWVWIDFRYADGNSEKNFSTLGLGLVWKFKKIYKF